MCDESGYDIIMFMGLCSKRAHRRDDNVIITAPAQRDLLYILTNIRKCIIVILFTRTPRQRRPPHCGSRGANAKPTFSARRGYRSNRTLCTRRLDQSTTV